MTNQQQRTKNNEPSSAANNEPSSAANNEPSSAGSPITPYSSPDKSSQKLTIYRANQRHETGLFKTWIVMASNVWGARELIWQLFKRDFFAVYKKSFIGVGWVFIAPILGVAQWVFLQLTGVLQAGEVGIPYPVYILIGTSMWGMFMGMYTAASETLTSGTDLILQVNYPHEALLFKQMAHQMANFVITLALNLIVLIGMHFMMPDAFAIDFPSWGMLLFPLIMLPVLFFSAAIGLFIAMVNVVAIDVTKFVNMGMAFMLYLTPVIYTAEKISNPIALLIIQWNPLTYLICSCRDILIYGTVYQGNWEAWVWAALLSFIMFMISWRLFYISENKLVERMV